MWTQNNKRLQDIFQDLTINFSPEDWRKVRNKDYYFSDYLPPEQAFMHKIERIRYYNANRVVKPYSPPILQMNIDEIENQRNEKKSILDPSKKAKDG